MPDTDLKRLAPLLTRVDLVYQAQIYASGDVIKDVYFPDHGIVSLLAVIGPKATIEVGIVGDEGMVGLPLFFGVSTSIKRAVVQGAGSAMKMTAADFLLESAGNEKFRELLLRFAYSLMIQISQSAVCNRFHPIDARLARWLLMTRDRSHSDEFPITQEFLSNMLGVRREAISRTASQFHRKGIITYTRGELTILDLIELRRRACACYDVIADDMADAAARG
ncbi:MAG: Crp/Fnr family transcriptional regulator [Pyrinomonadaceae bacterium]